MGDVGNFIPLRPESVPDETPGANTARSNRFQLLAIGPKPQPEKLTIPTKPKPQETDACVYIGLIDDEDIPGIAKPRNPSRTQPPINNPPVTKPPISWQEVVVVSVAMICGTAFAICWFCFRQPLGGGW